MSIVSRYREEGRAVMVKNLPIDTPGYGYISLPIRFYTEGGGGGGEGVLAFEIFDQ